MLKLCLICNRSIFQFPFHNCNMQDEFSLNEKKYALLPGDMVGGDPPTTNSFS
jgi:hypothetical protein